MARSKNVKVSREYLEMIAEFMRIAAGCVERGETSCPLGDVTVPVALRNMAAGLARTAAA